MTITQNDAAVINCIHHRDSGFARKWEKEFEKSYVWVWEEQYKNNWKMLLFLKWGSVCTIVFKTKKV